MDVYDALNTIVTTFVANIPKISVLVFLLSIVQGAGISGEASWTNVFLVSSFLSLIVGTVVGLVQFSIKKLLAFCCISHIVFLFLALAGLNQESTQAFIFYLSQYILINVNIFFIIVAIGYSLKNEETNYNLLDREHSPVQLISQLKGYFYKNPVLALSLAVALFSLMGIPPLLGFYGKMLVLSSALQTGYVFLSLIAILTSVVGGVYYLHIIKAMFFFGGSGKNGDGNKKNDFSLNQHSQIVPSSSLTIPISVLTLINLLFIIYPNLWLSSASMLSMTLFSI